MGKSCAARVIAIAVGVLTPLHGVAAAQTRPAAPAAAAPFNATPGLLAAGPVLVSPDIAADGRVTFRLAAPNARQVSVTGLPGGPVALQKDERGVWSGATAEPLAPDIYNYNFDVDGLRMTDPYNTKFYPGYRRVDRSLLQVPGDNAWTPIDGTPRGAVARHVFRSAVTNDEREFFVYTPPGYDPKRRKAYPVVVLQHGLSEDAKSWTLYGGANTTLDNLINQGKATPMIMVNTLGYGMASGPPGIDHPDMQKNFMRILNEEVMPTVYAQYNASKNREDHAIAGLSMGGGSTIMGGLNNLDKFAWFGSFSGAFNNWADTKPKTPSPPPAPGAPPEAAMAAMVANLRLEESALPAAFPGLDARANSRIKLLWIGVGTTDVLLRVNREFKSYLDSKGVKVVYTEFPGEGHVWPLWRRNFAEFATLIFK